MLWPLVSRWSQTSTAWFRRPPGLSRRSNTKPFRSLKPSMASITSRRRLLELLEVNVANAGADLIFKVHGGVGDFIADQREDQRFSLSFASHAHGNRRALGAFQGFGHQVRCHSFSGLAVDGRDHIARMNTRLECRTALHGEHHI